MNKIKKPTKKYSKETLKKRYEYTRKWRLRNIDHLKKYALKYWNDNKECLSKKAVEYRKNNMEKIKERDKRTYQKYKQKELDRIRFKKYGITGDEFRFISDKQNSICPICNKKVTQNLSVDHDHLTGKIRGLICRKCNLALGHAEDSPERLRVMANYLENN